MTRLRVATLRTVAILAFLTTLGGCATAPGTGDDPSGEAAGRDAADDVARGEAEILWDEWGVPHVYADDEAGLFRGFGWAMAEAHGDLLLGLYAIARGRAAEHWSGQQWARSDLEVRTFGIPGRSLEWYDALEPGERRLLDAFVDGINGWAEAHPGAVPDSLGAVLPVTGADALAHVQRVVHFGFVTGPWDAAGRLDGRQPLGGSNAWAIAPSRAAGGHAMLLANPHLPWRDEYTWFEAHMAGPGIDFSGATLVGMPFLAVGFNDRLGWTHTVNLMDGADLYALEATDGGYRWGDEVRAFDVRVDTLIVKGADGTVQSDTFRVRSSVHGPVVASREGTPLALRVVGLDQPHLLSQYLQMARARDLDEFRTALARLQMPFFNVVYADADGRLMYVFNGRVPIRVDNGWEFWTGVVPGDEPAYLWTETHPFNELPRVVDPPSGWVQNANDSPWTSTWPMILEPRAFPDYLTTWSVPFRPQRSIGMLRADDSIAFEELIAYKHSTRLEAADRLLDDLLEAVDEVTLDDEAIAADVAEAARILAAWDRRTDPDSRGAVLFAMWLRELPSRYGGQLQRAFARPWSRSAPLETPDGLALPERAVDALAEASALAQQSFGSADVAWGEVFRLKGDTLDLPGNGATDPLGSFRVTGFASSRIGGYRAAFGDSYVVAVEFSDPVRARGLLPYGNTSRPDSPHRWDQLPLYAEKRLRPVWRSRAEVEAHLERREVVPGR